MSKVWIPVLVIVAALLVTGCSTNKSYKSKSFHHDSSSSSSSGNGNGGGSNFVLDTSPTVDTPPKVGDVTTPHGGNPPPNGDVTGTGDESDFVVDTSPTVKPPKARN